MLIDSETEVYIIKTEKKVSGFICSYNCKLFQTTNDDVLFNFNISINVQKRTMKERFNSQNKHVHI